MGCQNSRGLDAAPAASGTGHASVEAPQRLSMKEFVGLCAEGEPMREALGSESSSDPRSQQLAVARQQLASLGCGRSKRERRGSDASLASSWSGQSSDSDSSDLGAQDMESGLGPDHLARLTGDFAVQTTWRRL